MIHNSTPGGKKITLRFDRKNETHESTMAPSPAKGRRILGEFGGIFRKKNSESQAGDDTDLCETVGHRDENRIIQSPGDQCAFDPTGENGFAVIGAYWLNQPFAAVNILKTDAGDLRYEVTEPKLTEKELIVLEETDDQLRSVLIYDNPGRTADLKLDPVLIHRTIRQFDQEMTADRSEVLSYYLHRNFQGYGKLDPLMHDDQIEDITCNGPGVPVFIYHQKHANVPTNIRFTTRELNRFVLKLAQKADKQLSLTTPLIDAALPDGSRIQITYSDVVSSKGSSFTIRKFKTDPMTPVDLIDYGTYDPALLAFIWLAVENRRSMIVVGGTASGKTSTMNAISIFIPQDAKIVSLEDTREIRLPHENWLALMTRETGIKSVKSEVDLFALLKSALRQRPEYIIVGEVRGREAETLFQAMNTGHTTYSTLHAGRVEQAINRLTNDPINVPAAMFEALDLMVIQGLHYKGGRAIRRCESINEIFLEGNAIRWQPLFIWNPVEDRFVRTSVPSRTLESIAYSRGWSAEKVNSILAEREQILRRMAAEGITGASDIARIVEDTRRSGVYGTGS